jgi:hypothetical protein
MMVIRRRRRSRDVPWEETFHSLHRHHSLTGRAHINSDNDDDGGARTAAGGSRATGGEDIDWENLQGDDE